MSVVQLSRLTRVEKAAHVELHASGMQKPSVDDDDEDAGAEVVEIARLVSELQGAASVEGRAESRPRTSANGRALRASIAVEVATGRTGAGKAGGVEARLAGWAGVGVRGE